MGLFNRVKEPIFLKESSTAEEQIRKLRKLEAEINEEGKAIIEQDIKYLEYGIVGEKNIAFELRNSHIPIYILHDIYLSHEDLSAQIDYLIFTRKFCFVIECKKLYGDIEVNNMGDFIRTMSFGKTKKKEGIYSPITQNKRHLELMRKIRYDQANLAGKINFDNNFNRAYKPLVVLANPKTVLKAKYAKKM